MFLAGLGTGKYPKDELKSVLVCITRRSVDFIRLSIFIRALMVGVQGVFNIPQPPADEFITKLLDLILNQDDPERAFVTFKDGDELVLLVHNQGGMSYLEMGAVVDETLNQLGKLKGYSFLIRLMKTFRVRGIVPVRIVQGCFMTSMNMPGISLSLLNLTNVAAECSFTSTTKLLELLDAPHNSPAWPANQGVYPLPEKLKNRKRQDRFVEVEKEEEIVSTGPRLISEGSSFEVSTR